MSNWPKPSDFDAKFAPKSKPTKQELFADAVRRGDMILRRKFEQRLRLLSKEAAETLQAIVDTLESEAFAAWVESNTGRNGVAMGAALANGVRAGGDSVMAVHYIVQRILEFHDRAYVRSLWSDELQQARGHKRRKIMMKLATPKWASMEAMVEIYRLRNATTEQTGISHHVDHIVPIQHHLVCGLNCEANLRVIPADENLRKRNKFTVGI